MNSYYDVGAIACNAGSLRAVSKGLD